MGAIIAASSGAVLAGNWSLELQLGMKPRQSVCNMGVVCTRGDHLLLGTLVYSLCLCYLFCF